MNDNPGIATEYLRVARADFERTKRLGERAMAQLTDTDMHFIPAGASNSIAVIVRHLAGNMLSRWTDFLTTDGEKPWRERDREFEETEEARAGILQCWNRGWSCLFDALSALKGDDLLKTVTIRGEKHTVVEAINRQTSHYAYHVGQIVQLAKMIRKEEWETLSIPRGKSAEFASTPRVPIEREIEELPKESISRRDAEAERGRGVS